MLKSVSRLNKNFFNHKPELVAKDLLGKLIVRKKGNNFYVGKIVETEAYLSKNDAACHASKKMTKRNEPMFGNPGTLYVYFTYGVHWMLNVVTESKGVPSSVLIRAVEPIYDSSQSIEALKLSERRKLGSGPARLTKWLNINSEFNRADISNDKRIWITSATILRDMFFCSTPKGKVKITKAKRIGVASAGKGSEKLLRYYIKDSKFVSKFI